MNPEELDVACERRSGSQVSCDTLSSPKIEVNSRVRITEQEQIDVLAPLMSSVTVARCLVRDEYPGCVCLRVIENIKLKNTFKVLSRVII